MQSGQSFRNGSSIKEVTCKPLLIMRLTALLPPPPTPITLILADSMGEKELYIPKWRRVGAYFRVVLGHEDEDLRMLVLVLILL